MWKTRNLLLVIFIFSSMYLGAIPLKDKDGNFNRTVLEFNIPKNYDDLTKLMFPTNEDIELDFNGFKEGSTIGPDGGSVYKWKEGTYKWSFKNGGELTYWNPSNWVISKDKFQFHVNGDNGENISKNFRFVDPEGTTLTQFYQKSFQTNIYYYENFKNQFFFQSFPEKLFTSKFKKSKRFQFFFEPEHEAWIDSFLEGEAYNRFEDYIREVGYTTSNQIPVVFFKNESQFRSYINLPKADCAGGRGGIFGLSFCNLNPVLGYIGESRDEREKSKAIHHTHMIYHEWGHHLQQIECAIVRKDQQYPNQTFSAWFNEGMAEYLGYIGSSKKRGNDRILFFEKYVLSGKQPNLTKEDPYLLGGQLFRHLAETYGDKAILKLWSDSCKGGKEETLIQNLTNHSPQELLNAYVKELSKYKSNSMSAEFLRETLADWAKDVYILKFVQSEPDLPDLTRTEIKPNLKQIFLLDIESIQGKLEGQFTTTRNEQIYLFKDGTYTIKGPDYNATYFQNQTVVYLSKGHEITEWPKGNVTWKDPNGKNYNFN